MTQKLVFQDVSKVFRQGDNKIAALSDVDLTIGAGEFAAVVGPSGSGKSTFLSIAGGLLQPSSGNIRIDGRSILDLSDKKMTEMRLHQIGFIFQGSNLIPYLTVEEQLLFISNLAGESKKQASSKAEQLLTHLGLAERRAHYPEKLSGGERQRVVIARAMMNEPNLILADEPTASLDSERGKAVVQMMADEVKSRNIATIMVTHDERMLSYCDSVYYMEDGRVTSQAA